MLNNCFSYKSERKVESDLTETIGFGRIYQKKQEQNELIQQKGIFQSG
jgi:hypothetical protein